MLATLLALVIHQGTAPKTFEFKDPKQVNAVSFTTDGTLEPFVGVAKGVEGSITFDPAHPENMKGSIRVDARTIELPLKGLEEAMKQKWCLDADGFPKIEFTIDHLENVKGKNNRFSGKAVGFFEVKGVRKPLTIDASASYHPGKAKERFGDKNGDLLVIRCDFSFMRLAHGVGKAVGENYVSNEIKVHAALVGTCTP